MDTGELNTKGKMTDLEQYNLARSGIHLVRSKDPDASVSQAKLMLTSSQGKSPLPRLPAWDLNRSVKEFFQRNREAFLLQNGAGGSY